MKQLAFALACVGILSAAEPNITSRAVLYHTTDIVPISTELRFTTLIELPKEETILEVTCGDKDYWPTNWTGNIAYVKAAKAGAKTNFNIITQAGNVYSFLATEVSNTAGGHADLKVFVTPSDTSALVALKDKPRFVSAELVDVYKQKAEEAQAQLAAQQADLRKQRQKIETEARAANTSAVRHDYRLSPDASKNPFNVSGIYHDDRFTYIEATPQEAPAVYETKDGKPSLIQFDFDERAHRYSIPKILDDGYLRVGKKELKFHRENR